MKNNEELIRDIFRRGDEALKNRDKKLTAIRNGVVALSVVCVTAVLGFGAVSRMETNVTSSENSNAATSENLKYSIQFHENILTEMKTENWRDTQADNTTTTQTVTETTAAHTAVSSISESAIFSEYWVESTSTQMVNTTSICTSSEACMTERTIHTAIETTVSSIVTDMMYSGACEGNVFYELNETTRTLYFIGSGSDVDVSAALPLVGKFDTVIINQGITSFEYISENHLFGTAGPLTIYCYSDFRTDHLQKFLGKHLTFVIFDE